MFRELPTADFGIDGQIEIVAAGEDGVDVATGRILSVQVKAGESYFRQDAGDAWLVPIPRRTVQYWQSHSVPVLLVLVDLANVGACYWTHASDPRCESTGDTVKIRVPKSQKLDGQSRGALADLAANVSPSGRRLAALEADVPWMQILHGGGELSVDVTVWHNKSSERKDIAIGQYGPDRSMPAGLAALANTFTPLSEFSTIGGGSVRQVLEGLFQWASLEIDEDVHDEDELYDRYLGENGAWDSEDKCYIDVLGEFKEWLAYHREREAYDEDGEVTRYRFTLELNKLGRAFLRVHAHLQRAR
jgi:hypothetical protein